MNVDIFALYVFSPYSRLSNVRENMYCERRYFRAVRIFELFVFIKYSRKYVL